MVPEDNGYLKIRPKLCSSTSPMVLCKDAELTLLQTCLRQGPSYPFCAATWVTFTGTHCGDLSCPTAVVSHRDVGVWHKNGPPSSPQPGLSKLQIKHSLIFSNFSIVLRKEGVCNKRRVTVRTARRKQSWAPSSRRWATGCPSARAAAAPAWGCPCRGWVGAPGCHWKAPLRAPRPAACCPRSARAGVRRASSPDPEPAEGLSS